MKSRTDMGMNYTCFLFVLDVMVLNLLDEGRRTFPLCRICVLSFILVSYAVPAFHSEQYEWIVSNRLRYYYLLLPLHIKGNRLYLNHWICGKIFLNSYFHFTNNLVTFLTFASCISQAFGCLFKYFKLLPK